MKTSLRPIASTGVGFGTRASDAKRPRVSPRNAPKLVSMTYVSALLASTASSAFAIEATDPTNHAILDQQQQRLLDQAREQREGLSTREPAAPVAAPRVATSQTLDVLGAQTCLPVENVGFSGAALLPDDLKYQIALEAAGRCLDNAELAHLLDEVNDWYVQHGYVTSHAWLPTREAGSGALVVAVVEGKLSRVYFADGDGRSRADSAARIAFAGTAGEPLNLRDIEQGVDQIDRIVPGGVKAAVRAAPQEGYSDVVLSGQPVRLFNFVAGIDNSGQKSTGRQNFNAAVTVNNALGRAEQLGVSATTTPAFHGDRFRRTFGAFATVPLGYWSFGYSGAAGNFAVPLDFSDVKLRYHGSSLQNRFTLTRTVERNAARKVDVFASLSNYVGNSYIEEFQLENGSERTSTAQVGVNFATRVGSKSYFTFSPAFTQGLPFATRDMSGDGGPSAGFRKLAASASLYTQITPSVAFLSSAYAQWAPAALFSSERMVVGGDTSVRGFRDQYLYANTGAYLRNEVDWSLPLPSVGTRVTMTAAIDAGRVVPVSGEPNASGNLVGAAIGASAIWKGATASLSVGAPLFAPKRLNADPIVLNVRLSSSF